VRPTEMVGATGSAMWACLTGAVTMESGPGAERPDVKELVGRLSEGRDPGVFLDAIASLLPGPGAAGLGLEPQRPVVGPVPKVVRGFQVRLDLEGTKPPVWRRLVLPGDWSLPRVHEAIQIAMGWSDSHLHRFRTGASYNSPHFVTRFDVDDGEDGILEDDVRLDQVITGVGDRLWYEYDFGDSWDHVIKVEKVLDTPPKTATCLTGKMACPPEDCGGVYGYGELAAWVRSGHGEALLPEVFEDAGDAHSWLPDGWDPDVFDAHEVNQLLSAKGLFM